MLRFFTSAFLFLIISVAANATTVSPLNIEMTSAGPHAHSQITVHNPSSEPVAIEPIVNEIFLNELGNPTSHPGAADFLILPMQAVIPPGGTQTFRVQWAAGAALPESRSYLVTMQELPVTKITAPAGMHVLMSFAVAINVAPYKGRPTLNLIDSGVTTDKSGARKPYLLVENPSQVHALLRDASITLAADNWSTTIPAGSLITQMGTGLVQPRKQRTFLLPVNVPEGITSLHADVDYQPGAAH